MTVKFDFVSDLHVDAGLDRHTRNKWKNGEIEILPWAEYKKNDILIIAGDTSNSPTTTCRVIKEARRYYDKVIFTDGNHDFYASFDLGKNVAEIQQFIYREVDDDPGVVYLDSYVRGDIIDDVMIVGCNGWYDWNANPDTMSREEERCEWERGMNDARLIDFGAWSPPDYAIDCSEGIEDHLNDAEHNSDIRAVLVVTHTVPLKKFLVSSPESWVRLNGSFYNSEMEKTFRRAPKTKVSHWLFGHTHFFYDSVEDGVRFITNPRGYPGERRSGTWTGFREIEI